MHVEGDRSRRRDHAMARADGEEHNRRSYKKDHDRLAHASTSISYVCIYTTSRRWSERGGGATPQSERT